MDRNIAKVIAEDFISTMNPEHWNGSGTKPDTFDTRIKTYNIASKKGNELDISFDYDEQDKVWEHYCELRDKLSGDLIVPLHGYGVDSVQNLADTIEVVCSGE